MKRDQYRKIDPDIVYKILNDELDQLKDENSVFIYNPKGQRLLIDKDIQQHFGFRVRIRGAYAETEFRFYSNRRKVWKSVGRHILQLTDPNITTDHINTNTLDNRRCNLRPLSKSDNSRNKRAIITPPTIGD